MQVAKQRSIELRASFMLFSSHAASLYGLMKPDPIGGIKFANLATH